MPEGTARRLGLQFWTMKAIQSGRMHLPGGFPAPEDTGYAQAARGDALPMEDTEEGDPDSV